MLLLGVLRDRFHEGKRQAHWEACHAGPLAGLYHSGQFVPLIVFFLMFLAIVKNNKLHHFVRFNCMQASASSQMCMLAMQYPWHQVAVYVPSLAGP